MTSERSREQRAQVALLGLAFVVTSAIVLLRLSAYGIWDPWELQVAEGAKKLLEHAGMAEPPSLGMRMVAAAFSLLAEREWAGRLPFALCGVGLLATTGVLAFRFASARVALYALIVLGTSPLFLLHSREMLGSTPTFLASSWVVLGASSAVFPSTKGAPSRAGALGWLALALLGAVLGTFAAGAMVSVVPPLLAVAAAAWMRGDLAHERGPAWFGRAIAVVALVLVALVVRTVLRHEAEPSLLTGGAPLDESVPSFERALEHVFHGFGAYSAVLPLALASLVTPQAADRTDQPLRLACMLWAALGYAAQTLYLSAYGATPFPAVAALALAVAFWLDDREREARPFWPEVTIALLFLGLLIRDYALYPASPWNSLELREAKAPDVFNPRREWALLLSLFGAGLLVSCMAYPGERKLALRAPYQGIKRTWQRSLGHKLWLSVAALAALSLLVFGVIAWLDLAAVPLTSLGVRIGRRLFFVVPAIPISIALGQLAFAYSNRLARARHGILLASSLALGGYTSQAFLPAVSEHFSPRDVFDTYNRLAKEGEPLAQHRVEGRAASYYAHGEVHDLAQRSELLDFLAQPGRRWAAFPADQLADIDVAFRKRAGRHLFVPTRDNARVTLAANQPVAGITNENPLARFVVREPPHVQHKVGALYEDAVELVGYDLKLPRPSSVGAGQSFEITWVWRALKSNIGSYKVFLHIDSGSQRINGDHEPVDGTYPVRLWDEGDVILDRQTVSVPATSPPGTYTLYVGFYRGDSRLKVTQGSEDGAGRVRAGTVQVQ
jgi:hypothetical protein